MASVHLDLSSKIFSHTNKLMDSQFNLLREININDKDIERHKE